MANPPAQHQPFYYPQVIPPGVPPQGIPQGMSHMTLAFAQHPHPGVHPQMIHYAPHHMGQIQPQMLQPPQQQPPLQQQQQQQQQQQPPVQNPSSQPRPVPTPTPPNQVQPQMSLPQHLNAIPGTPFVMPFQPQTVPGVIPNRAPSSQRRRSHAIQIVDPNTHKVVNLDEKTVGEEPVPEV